MFSATDSSKVAVKTLGLSQESYYQYGYIAIVNDDSFMSEVDLAGQLCWAWMSLMIAVTITFTACNMRMFHVIYISYVLYPISMYPKSMYYHRDCRAPNT